MGICSSNTCEKTADCMLVVFIPFFARLMGADPTTSRVTGECSTVELQPQMRRIMEKFSFTLSPNAAAV